MSAPTRILFEIHPHVVGGTERFLSRFVPRLDARRWRPLVIAPGRGAPARLLESLGIETVVAPHAFARADVAWIARLIKRREIALVQSNYYSTCLAMAANLAGVPHVWRLGGHVRVGSGLRRARDLSTTLALVRALSVAVVCNSRFIKSQFGRQLRTPAVTLIPNGVEPRPPIRPRPGDLHGCRVGMVAHFTPQKRHLDFLRAARIVAQARPDVQFVLLGAGYPMAKTGPYATRIRRLATRWLGERVRVAHVIDRDFDIGRYCDVVVLPSVGESCSNAVLEAMAAGLPLIAARSGGNPELIAHGRTGLLSQAARPGDIARLILRIVDRPALRRRLGHAARKTSRRRFSMSLCVDRYTRVYEAVLGRAR